MNLVLFFSVAGDLFCMILIGILIINIREITRRLERAEPELLKDIVNRLKHLEQTKEDKWYSKKKGGPVIREYK